MPAKGNFFEDNDDARWLLENRVDFDEIFALATDAEKQALSVDNAQDYKNTWIEMMRTVGEYAGDQLDGNAVRVSREDLVLKDGEVSFPPAISENIRTFVELGGSGLSVSVNYGGLGAPHLIELACAEMISRACPSTMLNTVWYGSIAAIIEKFGSDELKEKWIPAIAEGRVSGSMALTEPDVGSDLANVRTFGKPQPDGSWLVSGTKQFISNGCGEISLVLAKGGKGKKGLGGLCLFLVPRKINDQNNFTVLGLEDKPGLHGSATCSLEFKDSVGYLLGKEGEGFLYMLHLMNEARIAVGFQALGQMEAAFRLAREFAGQRKAFGKPIAQHELIAEKLLDMEVDNRGFRSLLFQAGTYHSLIEMLNRKLSSDQLQDDEREKAERRVAWLMKRLRNWTPLLKWWGGERSVVMARDALQIHGGYGFTTEYRAEWMVRESLILSIYEGTSQIQGLMCMKDTMKHIIKAPAEFAEHAIGMKLKGLSETNSLKRKMLKARQLVNSAVVSILIRLVKENARHQYNANKKSDIMKLVRALSRDILKFDNISPALVHAERLCEMKAITSMARCLVWDAEKDKEREWIAERFLNRWMPVLEMRKAEIESDDPVLRNLLDSHSQADGPQQQSG